MAAVLQRLPARLLHSQICFRYGFQTWLKLICSDGCSVKTLKLGNNLLRFCAGCLCGNVIGCMAAMVLRTLCADMFNLLKCADHKNALAARRTPLSLNCHFINGGITKGKFNTCVFPKSHQIVYAQWLQRFCAYGQCRSIA